MSRTCELCDEPAYTTISARVSPTWGADCEHVRMFACEKHFDAVWARIDEDHTLSRPHVLPEKRRTRRVMPAGSDF